MKNLRNKDPNGLNTCIRVITKLMPIVLEVINFETLFSKLLKTKPNNREFEQNTFWSIIPPYSSIQENLNKQRINPETQSVEYCIK